MNKLVNSFDDEEDIVSEGENMGDKEDQFEANIQNSGKE